MDIRIFIGAHRTAGLHIEQTVRKNATLLNEQGIGVVKTHVNLPALKTANEALENGHKRKAVYDQYIETVTRGTPYEKLVILDRGRCGAVTRPTGKKLIYPHARFSVAKYGKFIAPENYRLFMGIRSLATFLPSCYSESLTKAKVETFEEFIGDTDLRNCRWSDTLERIVKTVPRRQKNTARLVTWRYEDYARMWRDVVGAVTGIENPQDLVGESTPVNKGLSLYGSQLMYKYLQEHSAKAPGDFKKIRDAFLDKFSQNTHLDPDPIGPPGFKESLDYAYEDDWYYIERMENVATLSARPVI